MILEDRNTCEMARIRAAIARWNDALQNKNAWAVAAQQTADFVHYSLAPPLIADTSTTDDLEEWFATWNGPIGYALYDATIATSGDLAICCGLAHLTGEKIDGHHVDLWFRVTLALTKADGGWKIAHEHNSVPFYMDGSFRAAVDLRPSREARENQTAKGETT